MNVNWVKHSYGPQQQTNQRNIILKYGEFTIDNIESHAQAFIGHKSKSLMNIK